jgi:hypothetical protein
VVELWVNGELKATADIPDLDLYNTGSSRSSIGAYARGANFFWSGLIALDRNYNQDLTEAEIQQAYYHKPILDGLVLWLMPQRAFEGTWWDRSGKMNHGTIYGATPSAEEFHLPPLRVLSV